MTADDEVRSFALRMMAGLNVTEVTIADDVPEGVELVVMSLSDPVAGTRLRMARTRMTPEQRREAAHRAAVDSTGNKVVAGISAAMRVDRDLIVASVMRNGGSVTAAIQLVESLGFEVTP